MSTSPSALDALVMFDAVRLQKAGLLRGCQISNGRRSICEVADEEGQDCAWINLQQLYNSVCLARAGRPSQFADRSA